jgi:hypothetical protein
MGKKKVGWKIVKAKTAIATILLVRRFPMERTYAPSKIKKRVSFCIRVLPQPSAISGILF